MIIVEGMKLPGDGSVEALRSLVEMNEPANLTKFLAGFQYTSPALSGDIAAIQVWSDWLTQFYTNP